MNAPSAVALDDYRNIYILDTNNYRVVKWLFGDPVGYAIAGGRGSGTTLDKLGTCYAMYLDSQLNLYISEFSNHRISKWMNGNNVTGTRVCLPIVIVEE